MLQKLRKKLRDHERKMVANYRDVVRAVADGKDVDSDEILHILDEAGRTVDQLEADAQLLRDRRRWAADFQRLEEFYEKQPELEKRLQQLRDQRQEAIVKAAAPFDEKLDAIEAERQKRRQIESKAREARQRLLQTGPTDDAVNAEKQRLREETGHLEWQVHKRIPQRIDALKAHIQELQDKFGRPRETDGDVAQRRKAIKEAEREIASLRKEQDRLWKRRNELCAQEEQLRDERLDPEAFLIA